MKKIFYLLSFCALAFISCQKEEMEGLPETEGKYTYEFVAYQQAEPKATIGDKVDNQWPVLWSKGDQMGVYKADGTFVGVATVSDECEGQNSGNFKVPSDVELTEGEELYFSYPYVASAEIKTGKVAAEQTLGTYGVGANAIAYAKVQYVPGDTEFVLSHANAYLKFNIKSEEFAGYNLTGVTLWADGAELAGSVNIADGGALTVSAAEDYVKASLATPVAVSASDAQAVCVAALPVDLSAKTVYAIVHMKGVAGTETATHTVELPVRLNGAKALNAGAVTEINLPSLAKSLAPKWYEPVETRYVAAYGKGWSYGDENTVVFTGYKTDAVQTVDLKARGNFMKVTEPKKVRVKYLNGLNDCTSPLGVYVDGTCITTYAAGTEAETFSTAEIGSTYTISVSVDNHKYLGTLGSAGYISAMEVLDADDNVIWGINLWLRLKALGEIQYANGIIMDRNLGVDEKGDANTWRASGNYFQWGRPFAIQSQSNNYTKKHFTKAEATAVTSLDVSAANPFTLYYYAAGASYKDWYYGDGTTSRENDLDDLWGNPEGDWSSTGVKSIYDPCPHGWMVASPAILKEVSDGLASGDATFTSGTYPYITYNGAVWGYAGGYTCDGYNSGMNWKAIGQLFAYWSNASTPDSGYARNIFTTTYASAPDKFDTSFSKARAMPIRCMKDTENR